MGWAGYLFAALLLPTIAYCFFSKEYKIIGAIMLVKWICFIAPVRSLFDFGNEPIYFAAISFATIILLGWFCIKLTVAKIIIGLLSLSIIFSYTPLALDYVSIRQSLIVSEVFAYAQILAIWGEPGGKLGRYLWRKLYNSSNPTRIKIHIRNIGPVFRRGLNAIGRIFWLENQQIQNSVLPIQGDNNAISKEAKR